MSYALSMSGRIGSDPDAVTDDPQEALSKAISLSFEEEYDAVMSGGGPIAGTSLVPYEPDLGSVNAVRAIAIRALDGQSMQVLLTSGAGVDQVLPISDLIIVRAQNPGDQYTAIRIIGTGRIEYIIAGNDET